MSIFNRLRPLRALEAGVLILLAFAGVASRASAGLVLTVDTTAQTFSITGSDTGSGAAFTHHVTWSSGGSPTASNNVQNISTAFATGAGGVALYEFTGGIVIDLNPANYSLVGSGTSVDYSSYSTTEKSYLNSISSMALVAGSGYGAVSVVQTAAIPEPSTYALMCGAGALTGALLFRRKRVR